MKNEQVDGQMNYLSFSVKKFRINFFLQKLVSKF